MSTFSWLSRTFFFFFNLCGTEYWTQGTISLGYNPLVFVGIFFVVDFLVSGQDVTRLPVCPQVCDPISASITSMLHHTQHVIYVFPDFLYLLENWQSWESENEAALSSKCGYSLFWVVFHCSGRTPKRGSFAGKGDFGSCLQPSTVLCSASSEATCCSEHSRVENRQEHVKENRVCRGWRCQAHFINPFLQQPIQP